MSELWQWHTGGYFTEDGKLTGKPVKLLWYGDLSKLVTETYGRPYNYLRSGITGIDEPTGQGTIDTVTIPGETEPEDLESVEGDDPFNGHYIRPSFEEWRTKEPSEVSEEYAPAVQPILNDLYERGLIEDGDYVIHKWW